MPEALPRPPRLAASSNRPPVREISQSLDIEATKGAAHTEPGCTVATDEDERSCRTSQSGSAHRGSSLLTARAAHGAENPLPLEVRGQPAVTRQRPAVPVGVAAGQAALAADARERASLPALAKAKRAVRGLVSAVGGLRAAHPRRAPAAGQGDSEAVVGRPAPQRGRLDRTCDRVRGLASILAGVELGLAAGRRRCLSGG